jgi:DNA replication protein DnaC
MRRRDHPHLTRQHRTQLLQSVAFTPGTGKTHLAVGLARAAAHAGYRTYFTTAADLAARCHRAAIEGRWATTMRFYAGPTLLAIDELLSQESA